MDEDAERLLPRSEANGISDSASDSVAYHGQGHYAAFAISWIMGCAFLFPWNALLTVEDYYYVVFPNDHPSRVFTIVYEPFALITTFIFLYYEARASTRWRILSGFALFIAAIALAIVIDVATHGSGGIGSFVGMCFLIAMLGIGDGTAQGGLVGDLSFMHPSYLQAYNAGLAASGVATTVMRMITKVAFGDGNFGLRKGALVFWGVAGFVEVVGVVLYAFVFPRLEAVKFYRGRAANEGSKTVNDDLTAAGVDGKSQDAEYGNTRPRKSTSELFFENWDYALMLVLIYLLSLSIFPGFLYEDTGKHQLGDWYALVLIAMYNGADLISRFIPLVPALCMRSRRLIMITCLARFALIPCFYFTAKYADAGYMIFLCIILGLTNGYLTVVVFTRAPEGYISPEQNALGNILISFLIVGLFLGVTSDWLWLIGKGW
ncbi:unnamed protein product [Calypogeia fissa]